MKTIVEKYIILNYQVKMKTFKLVNIITFLHIE